MAPHSSFFSFGLSRSQSPSESFPSNTGGRLGLEETNQPRQPAAFLPSVCVYGQKEKDAAPCRHHQMHQAGSILTLMKDDNKNNDDISYQFSRCHGIIR